MNIDFSYLGKLIADLTGLAVKIYKNNKEILYFSLNNYPIDITNVILNEVNNDHIGYILKANYFYYGFINYNNYKIIIGPTYEGVISEQIIKELAFLANVKKDDENAFYKSIKSTNQIPLFTFIEILCALNYYFNNEKSTLENIIIHENKNLLDENIDNDYQKENITHNTIALEEKLLNMIRLGDTASLKEWVNKAPGIMGGKLALNQLRQLKNTFIVTATLASRAAIAGGMDEDTALSLSDKYIQRCELLNNIENITNLQYKMLLDYTTSVEKIRFTTNPSKLLIAVTNYVKRHLSGKIDINALAKNLFISRTYLAARFKKETGLTLTEYFIKQKIEEAKYLLKNSNKPLNSISLYLGFSSPSHFANVFKKYTNLTPNEYRKKS